MLNNQEKSTLRERLFRHIDGIAVAPVANALHTTGITQVLLDEKKLSIANIAERFHGNEGYLNVALHVLASQGWLDLDIENDVPVYSINEKSKIAFDHFYLYDDIIELMQFSENYHPRKFESEPFKELSKIFNKYKKNYDLQLSSDPFTSEIQHQILAHIEGNIVGPSVVHLGMSGMFHKYFMETRFKPEEFHKHPESFTTLLDFFTFLGWFNKKKDSYEFTDKGLFFARRASAYGVTVSYIPTFRKMNDLLFGDPNILRINQTEGDEIHVDRAMNVWGSGGAHSTYFKVIDDVIINIFNRDIESQPKGILDMGCGNGALLQHLYEVIESQTLRGKMLEEYPLFLIGADFNEAAIKVTRANLISADIWAKVIKGDVSDPATLAQHLLEDYGIILADLLNVRSFLDHNRIWEYAEEKHKSTNAKNTGAFASRGLRLTPSLVQQNLTEHFEKWAPHVNKFGLLVIELHTISPQLCSQNLGKTMATAYDATHGFTDQYIVDIESFHNAALDSGLKVDRILFRKFPDSDIATVSVNLLKGF
ncbi:MAG TPA: class I SAM-dependent methyltransferase [Saprospiraceae bacterium]|nr:class I SAM-dependent methyltransferase [Lewinellaceae bacterium]HPQ20445.1 class I SAM-dependent methyltransferase [Saprospiraceae bacterium]